MKLVQHNTSTNCIGDELPHAERGKSLQAFILAGFLAGLRFMRRLSATQKGIQKPISNFYGSYWTKFEYFSNETANENKNCWRTRGGMWKLHESSTLRELAVRSQPTGGRYRPPHAIHSAFADPEVFAGVAG